MRHENGSSTTTYTTRYTTSTTSDSSSYINFPHNPTTYTYSVIAFLLCIGTGIVYTALILRTCDYHRNKEMIENPHSPSSRKRRATLQEQDKNFKIDEWNPIRSSILNSTIISCSFLMAASLITFFYILHSQMYKELYTLSGMSSMIVNCQIAIFALGKLLVHCIFIMRLYFTFKDVPMLRYPNSIFYLAAVLIVLGGLLSCLLLPLAGVINAHYKHLTKTTVISLLSALLYLGDFFGSLLVLFLFVKKLHQVFIQRKSCSQKDLESKQVTFGAADEQMLSTIVKLTLLSLLSAFGGLLLFIAFMVRAEMDMTDSVSSWNLWRLIYPANLFMMISCLINVMALYFILSFATDHYRTYCKCPHAFLRRTCKYGFKAAILRQRKKWTSRQNSTATTERSEAQQRDLSVSDGTDRTQKITRTQSDHACIQATHTMSVDEASGGSRSPSATPIITPAASSIQAGDIMYDDHLSPEHKAAPDPDIAGTIPMTKVSSLSSDQSKHID